MHQILKIKRNIHIKFRFLKIFIKNSLLWLDYITCKQTTLIRWKITSSFLPCHNGIPQWVDLLVAILCSMLWNEAPHAAVVFTLSSHMRWAQDLLGHSQHGYIIALGKYFFVFYAFEALIEVVVLFTLLSHMRWAQESQDLLWHNQHGLLCHKLLEDVFWYPYWKDE